MSFCTISSEVWKPLADEQLSWFRAEQKIFAAPRPLEYTLEIHAVVFALTYALESVEFPLYAVRSRLHNGRVYLAAVPSAMAERDLTQRIANIHEQSLRYTRNLGRAWQYQIKPEVERYNRWFEEAASFAGSDTEMAEWMRRLRRARANQWFAAIRGVNLPLLLLRHNIAEVGAANVETGAQLSKEAMVLVRQSGGELVSAALLRIGQRLAQRDAIDQPDDVYWFEWHEARAMLQTAKNSRALIAQRKFNRECDWSEAAPDRFGPELPADAPRMYLLKEVLELLD